MFVHRRWLGQLICQSEGGKKSIGGRIGVTVGLSASVIGNTFVTFFLFQCLAVSSTLPVTHRCALHAITAAYLNLISQLLASTGVCEYVQQVSVSALHPPSLTLFVNFRGGSVHLPLFCVQATFEPPLGKDHFGAGDGGGGGVCSLCVWKQPHSQFIETVDTISSVFSYTHRLFLLSWKQCQIKKISWVTIKPRRFFDRSSCSWYYFFYFLVWKI